MIKLFVATILSSLFVTSHGVAKQDDLLEKIDSYRNPSRSYEMEVEIEDLETKKSSEFTVSLKDNNKTLIKTESPKRDKGRNMLMVDENMWVFIPNLKRAIRVNMSQKLVGQAAIGDISRMRWAGDYTAKEVPHKDKNEVRLELTADKKGLTYDKITVFIEAKTKKPLRALLRAKSGKVLKKASYLGYKNVEGAVIPHKMVLTDYLNNKRKTHISIKKIRNKKFPDSLFNQRSLN